MIFCDAISAAIAVPTSAPKTVINAVAALIAPWAAKVAEIIAVAALLCSNTATNSPTRNVGMIRPSVWLANLFRVVPKARIIPLRTCRRPNNSSPIAPASSIKRSIGVQPLMRKKIGDCAMKIARPISQLKV